MLFIVVRDLLKSNPIHHGRGQLSLKHRAVECGFESTHTMLVDTTAVVMAVVIIMPVFVMMRVIGGLFVLVLVLVAGMVVRPYRPGAKGQCQQPY